MLSRHFLRSKVLQAIYAAKIDNLDLNVAEKNFKHNIARLNDLGTMQLAALVHFAEVANTMMNEGQQKFLPTEEELNPNRRLAENIFIQRLAENFDLRHHIEEAHVSWEGVEFDEAFRKAYTEFIKFPEYQNYLQTEPSFATDQKFALNIFKFLMNYEPICDIIFPMSLLWEEDYDQIAQYNYMMLKAQKDTLDESTEIPLMYDKRSEKDQEAFLFANKLLLFSLRRTDEVEKMIRKHIKNWDFERIAGMDILLLNMAVAELTEFPSIPERVTVDEYIELSKEFSTDRSKLFINGILDKFIIELRSAGKIQKTGRGLMDPDFSDEDSNED